MATSKATHQDLQQLATNVEVKLTALQSLFENTNQGDQAATIANLKKTVTSAATVISSGATEILDVAEFDDFTSDVGDWFRSEASLATLEWIYSDNRDQPLFSLDVPSLKSHTTLDPSHARGGRTLPVHAASTSNITEMAALPNVTEGKKKAQPLELNDNQKPGAAISVPTPKMNGVPDSKAEPQPQKTLEDTETPLTSPKPTRKRWNWFRSSRSEGLIKIRDPVMVDPGSKASKRRTAKIPRRLKVVFVGDGACGKTCLLM